MLQEIYAKIDVIENKNQSQQNCVNKEVEEIYLQQEHLARSCKELFSPDVWKCIIHSETQVF